MDFSLKIPDFEGGSGMKIWKPLKFFISRKMVGGRGVNQSGQFPDFTGFSILRASLIKHSKTFRNLHKPP